MMLHAWEEQTLEEFKARSVETHHHNNICKDVTVLVNKSSDASSSDCDLLTEANSVVILVVIFFFCNNLISFYCLKGFITTTQRKHVNKCFWRGEGMSGVAQRNWELGQAAKSK